MTTVAGLDYVRQKSLNEVRIITSLRQRLVGGELSPCGPVNEIQEFRLGFFFPREGDIQVNSPGDFLTASLLSKCGESFDPIFPRGWGGGMLVAPHRVAAGQRFGLGSGLPGSGCCASGRL